MFKRVRVTANEKALVFKNGALIEVLSVGKYWKRSQLEVEILDVTLPFNSTKDRDLMLQNEILLPYLEVIEVKDNEVAFQYLNGNFNKVLTAGRNIYWKGIKDYSYKIYDTSQLEVPLDINRKLFQYATVSSLIRVYVVEGFEKGVLFLDGVFNKIMEPGIYYYWKNEMAVQIYKADLRMQQMEINGQEILTKDKANLRINFYADYQITDLMKSLVDVKDYVKQLYSMMQMAMRDYIGRYTLDELLANKDAASSLILDTVKVNAADLGVSVGNCGIRDIILPGDVKEIMNQVLVAEKKAQANVIMRREETASTRSLLNTAKLMEDNEMLYKLKEMEYVEKIAENISNITFSGGGQIVDQLKTMFSPSKIGKSSV